MHDKKYWWIYLVGKKCDFSSVESFNSSLNIYLREMDLDFFPKVKRNHVVLINRSRRKRVAGRKRHPETDKVSSPANTSVGERYRDIRAMHRSFWLFSGAPSEENKRGGTFYTRSRLVISSLFEQTAADRPTDRIDSHRSGLDTLAFPRRFFWSHDTCRTGTRTGTTRAYFRSRNSGRKHCLRRFQHPLCRSHFIRIGSSSLIVNPGVVCCGYWSGISSALLKTDIGIMWGNERDYFHVV